MKDQYEDHDDSDPEEDVDDEEETLVMNRSPESKLSNKQMQERLRKVAEVNRNVSLAEFFLLRMQPDWFSLNT